MTNNSLKSRANAICSKQRWRDRILLFIDERSAESFTRFAIALFIDERSAESFNRFAIALSPPTPGLFNSLCNTKARCLFYFKG
ncbi:MAG: hypothetical protein U7123_17230 [Potamolinea sp.]